MHILPNIDYISAGLPLLGVIKFRWVWIPGMKPSCYAIFPGFNNIVVNITPDFDYE